MIPKVNKSHPRYRLLKKKKRVQRKTLSYCARNIKIEYLLFPVGNQTFVSQ